MPKVCFYPLRQGSTQESLVFACRLVDKATQLGHRVHLLVRDENQLKLLDDLLWQFRADSFIPHQRLSDDHKSLDTRVTLGTKNCLPKERDVLINLTETVWDQHAQFPDIREVVPASEEDRTLGRQRYRFYQDQGYTVETKKLTAN
ncbi:MAG: DNA polymerase III subunit chi [Gammaproteobacteria bacterium]